MADTVNVKTTLKEGTGGKGMPSGVYLVGRNGHYLKSKSSLIVVILRSLRHCACVSCGTPLRSLEESGDHWYEELGLEK